MKKLRHHRLKRRTIWVANLIFSIIFLLLLHKSSLNAFGSWKSKREEKMISLELNMRRLVRETQRDELQSTGFSCNFDAFSDVCVATKQVRIDTKNLIVYLSPSQVSGTTTHRQFIKPSTGKEYNLKSIIPLQIIQETNSNLLPNCEFQHTIPAIIFYSGGFSWNLFHGFNNVIIPLFLTSRHFKSQVQFVVTNYSPWWVQKFDRIFKQLSSYEVIGAPKNGSVHCFPGVVMGLMYHKYMGINNSSVPSGYKFSDFRQFLRETYGLKREEVLLNPNRLNLLLILRRNSRVFLNEDEMIRMMIELGFEVRAILPNEMTNLDKFSQVVNSCDVMVGVHGAGITNMVFLPKGAVVVQVVPIGVDWVSKTYFGKPALDMDLKYLEYRVEKEESSLFESYGPNHSVLTNPGSIHAKKGYKASKAIYLSGQNVTINITRFKHTLSHVVNLLGH